MYTIYEIPGIKIGVSKDVEKRVKKQGFFNYNVLETHTCIYEVSARERELQKEYGYRVDHVPYHIMEANASSAGKLGGVQNRRLTMNDAEEIRAEYALGNITQKVLGERYGVSMRRISDIVNFKAYRSS